MSDTTSNFPTAESALEYRHAHDVRVKALSRMTMPTLRDVERARLAAQGIQRLSGGLASKDELINAIVADEYPAELMNESSHVLYHKPGEQWSACDFCQPEPQTFAAHTLAAIDKILGA